MSELISDVIKFEKTIIYKGRIAPKGLIFFIASKKVKGGTKYVYQLVDRRGASVDQENTYRNMLVDALNKD